MLEAIFENSVTVIAIQCAMRSPDFKKGTDRSPRRRWRSHFPTWRCGGRECQGHRPRSVAGSTSHFRLGQRRLGAKTRHVIPTSSGTLSMRCDCDANGLCGVRDPRNRCFRAGYEDHIGNATMPPTTSNCYSCYRQWRLSMYKTFMWNS